MGYFAGLDVSLEETTICVVDDAGRSCVRGTRGESRFSPDRDPIHPAAPWTMLCAAA